MKVYIATDHAGFALKNTLVAYLQEEGHEVMDMGAQELVEDDDYPDYITPCARAVVEDASEDDDELEEELDVAYRAARTFGIIIGGSGQGEAMAANRVRGARAAVYYGAPAARHSAIDAEGTLSKDSYDIVRLPRMHNDANLLSLGARFLTDDDAKHAVTIFLETPFSEAERHIRRIQKIEDV